MLSSMALPSFEQSLLKTNGLDTPPAALLYPLSDPFVQETYDQRSVTVHSAARVFMKTRFQVILRGAFCDFLAAFYCILKSKLMI